jgi:hypothetical protein
MVSFVPPTSNTLELASELCTYLKPKLFALENADLCNVHTALVLLPRQDTQTMRALESVTLRRVHSMDASMLTRVLKSYSMLRADGKQLTLVKALATVILQKPDEFTTD